MNFYILDHKYLHLYVFQICYFRISFRFYNVKYFSKYMSVIYANYIPGIRLDGRNNEIAHFIMTESATKFWKISAIESNLCTTHGVQIFFG